MPWFETAERRDAKGRFLLFSYHFPPSTRIGALRWQEFTRHFGNAGWAFDVVMLRPEPDDRQMDRSLLDELGPGLRLYAVPHPEHPLRRIEQAAYELIRGRAANGRRSDESDDSDVDPDSDAGESRSRRVRRQAVARNDLTWSLDRPRGWMRMYWSWVWRRHHLSWARRARTLGRRLAAQHTYAAVISSGPPHETHLAAGAVAERANAPCVIDLRDPWSHAPYMPEWLASPLSTRLAERDERRCLGAASLVVANTEALEAVLVEQYPEVAGRIITVRNGFDPLANLPDPAVNGNRFTVRYAGSIYYNRDPRPLIEGAASLVRELRLTSEQFGLELIGSVDPSDGGDIRQLAARAGIADYVRVGPWRPREDAERFMAGAHVLVALPGHNDLAVPGKVYEYMRYPAWILALADPGSATDRLLDGTAAEVVPTKDADAVAAALRRLYEAYERDGRPEPLSRHSRFGRRSQAMKLLEAIQQQVARREDELRVAG